jgi:hypothetical protein
MDSAKKWNALAETWNETGPPASPSTQDIKNYQMFIRKATRGIDGASILMLGCSPILRTIIRQLNLSVTCVDISEKMLIKTTSFLSNQCSNENLVCQNWLEMDLHGFVFQVVIGDKVLDNVPYSQWLQLKKQILIHLKPEGAFITRIAPQDFRLLNKSFYELLVRWSTLYERGDVSIKQAVSGLWEQALGASAKSIPGSQSINFFADEINELVKNMENYSTSTRTIMCEFLDLFGTSSEYEWSAYTLGSVIDALSEELTLVALARADDYPTARRQPILMFQSGTNLESERT